MDTSVIDDIPKVVLSAYNAPGMERHGVVLRHVIHDLESGKTGRAIDTLRRAGDTMSLQVLAELATFLEKQSSHLAAAARAPSWNQTLKPITSSQERWEELINVKEFSELFEQTRYLHGTTLSSDAPAVASMDELPVHRVHSSKPFADFQAPLAALDQRDEKVMDASVQPRMRDSRVNYTAAAATFVLTLLGVLIWWFSR